MTINKTSYGVVLGLVLPAITAWALYTFVYSGFKSFGDFIDGLIFLDSAALYIAVCVLSNLAFFLVFAQFDRLKIARGILLSTILYAMVVLIFKFVIQ